MIDKITTAGKTMTMLVLIFTLNITFAVRAQEPAGSVSSESVPSESALIKTAQAVQKTISETLTVYGRVQPAFDAVVTISLPHAGLVTHVGVRMGQRVKHGDTLMGLTTSPAAYVQYIQARNAEKYANLALIRQQRMLKEQLSTKAKVNVARRALFDARSRLNALEKQGQNRTYKILTSPMDGIVVHLGVKQGDRVQADTAALTIASEDHLTARLGIEPEDIHLIKPGTPVTIHSIFVPDYQVKTRLLEIHAMINPATHLVDALAPIPVGKTDHLVLGSYLKADIELMAHIGITVPRSAVLEDDQGHYVFIVVNGRAKRINVETGLENYKWIEITKGLKSYEKVVNVGNYVLKDGMAVREKK